MSKDQYLFLEPDEAVYVMTKCKDGYEVFRMYVDKTRGTCSAFVENIGEREAVSLSTGGNSLIEGYRKKKTLERDLVGK
jgi:hypothetical protein